MCEEGCRWTLDKGGFALTVDLGASGCRIGVPFEVVVSFPRISMSSFAIDIQSTGSDEFVQPCDNPGYIYFDKAERNALYRRALGSQ